MLDGKKGLFELWMDVELSQRKLVDALDGLNEKCGTNYKHNWPSVMEGRGYSLERIPTEVRRYMMNVVLRELFPGMAEMEIKKLITALT